MNLLPIERQIDILLDLNDKNLSHMCRVDRSTHSICEDDYFWHLRTERYFDLDLFLHLRKYFTSWKNFYLTLSKDTVYLVRDGPFIRIANNINVAFELFKSMLGKTAKDINIEDAEIELEKYIEQYPRWYGESNATQIYIMMVGIEVPLGDPDFLLLSLGSEDEFLPPHLQSGLYFRENFSRFPPLPSREGFIAFIHSSPENNPGWREDFKWNYMPEIMIGIEAITQEGIDKIFKYFFNKELFFNRFNIRPINTYYGGVSGSGSWNSSDGSYVYQSITPAFTDGSDNIIFYHKKYEEYRIAFFPKNLTTDEFIDYVKKRYYRFYSYSFNEKNVLQPRDQGSPTGPS